MYLFLKQLKLSFASTLFGSITYAFAGYGRLVARSLHCGLCRAFLPLALYSVEKSNLFLLVTSLVLSVFSGFLQIALYV